MLRISTKKHWSFTLIELLVVIAIIGILAGIILVLVGPAREKAKDTKIKSNMLQLQQVAENIYLDEGNYSKVGPAQSPEIASLVEDIVNQGGMVYFYKPLSSINRYCAYSLLNKKISGQYLFFCVDHLGNNIKIGGPRISCNTGCYKCPVCVDTDGDELMGMMEMWFDLFEPCFNQPASCNPSLDASCNGTIDIDDWNLYWAYLDIPCP